MNFYEQLNFFLHDYFLHVQPTPIIWNYKPSEYKQLAKLFLKKNPFPCNSKGHFHSIQTTIRYFY
jgi:hypothetical protein